MEEVEEDEESWNAYIYLEQLEYHIGRLCIRGAVAVSVARYQIGARFH